MKTITGGSFQDSKGNPANGAIITFVLLSPEVATNIGQVYPNTVSFVLDASGNLPAASQIWANDELTPTGSVYRVTVVNPSGQVLYGPQTWSIVGTSPISITNMTPVSAPAGLVVSNVAIEPGVSDAILYVSNNGNDANTGLSWGNAKATIQAALNALPATGGTVFLSAGSTFTISSTIIAPHTNGPIYHLIGSCPATRDDNSGGSDKHTVISYTGTGTAIQSNAFASIQNLYLVGPSSSGSTIGIDCNGDGTIFRGVNIGGFGTGWFLDSGCFIVSYEDGSIHDNGTNIGSAVTPTSAGENISFIGVLISDNAANTNATSINFVTSPGTLDIKFVNCSLDGVGITIGSAGNFSFLGCHFEILNSGTHVVPVQITHNQCNVSFVGCRMLQDTGGSTAAEFILNSANLGNNILISGGSYSQGSTSMTNVVTNQAGNPAAKLTLIGMTTDIAVRQSGTWAQVIDLDLGQINNGEIMSETGTGFGNGAAGTAVTTTLKGTGSGPTTPQTVVKYVSIDVAGVTYWVPLVQ